MSATSPTPVHRSAYYWIAVVSWLVATLYTWPVALSFEDEVGYVGAARMLRGGAVQPSITMPGI